MLCIRIQSITIAKTICRIKHTKKKKKKKKKKIETKKWLQRWKSTAKIDEQCVYDKTMENLRKRIDVKLASNKKDYLKWTSKTKLYVTKKYLTMIWSQHVKVKLH